jgi:hypothetical protein
MNNTKRSDWKVRLAVLALAILFLMILETLDWAEPLAQQRLHTKWAWLLLMVPKIVLLLGFLAVLGLINSVWKEHHRLPWERTKSQNPNP